MKKLCWQFTLLIAIFFCGLLFTGTPGYAFTSDLTKTMNGVTKVSDVLLYQTFTPGSHFQEGSWSIQATPSYIEAERLFEEDSPVNDFKVTSDDFSGKSFGIGFTYNFNSILSCFTSLSAFKAGGTVEVLERVESYPGPGMDIMTHFESELEVSTYTGILGVGFDAFGWFRESPHGSCMSSFSVPIYTGLYMRRYSIDGDVTPLSGDTFTPYLDISANGTSTGMFFAIAYAFRILDSIDLSFYYISSMAIADSEIEALVIRDNPSGPNSYYPVGSREEINAGGDFYNDVGINVIYKSESSWSISASVTGILGSNPVQSYFLDGLQMKVYTLTFAYHGI
jgi:hypothetical protein